MSSSNFDDGDDLFAVVRAQHQTGLLTETPTFLGISGQGVGGDRVAVTERGGDCLNNRVIHESS